MTRTVAKLAVSIVLALSMLAVSSAGVLGMGVVAVRSTSSAVTTLANASSARLVVPTQYPTIQAAVDAAPDGATIRVRRGTYVEQIRIAKRLRIIGAGKDRTIIRAPADLVDNDAAERVIVDISDGAQVRISHLTVAGPGSGTCDVGALTAGIRVRNGADLRLRYAAVRHIHDTPFAACFHSATAVFVGDIPAPAASATIDHSSVTDYQGAGIVVLGFGSAAVISHNVVRGPGMAKGVGTGGIEFPVGSVGRITYNTVSGNACPPADTTCGTDWFNQFQNAGILAGGWGPGTVVSHNLTYGNQVGMMLGEADLIRDNRMIDNDFFGLALVDGDFEIDGGLIKGGGGGVWAIADAVDTHVVLDDVRIRKLSGPRIGKVECCGFTATVTTED